MAQHLENTDKFFWTRKTRFPEQFLGDIQAMVHSTAAEITAKLEVGICNLYNNIMGLNFNE